MDIHTDELRFSTGGDAEVVDITAAVQGIVLRAGVGEGQAVAFARGSTAATSWRS